MAELEKTFQLAEWMANLPPSLKEIPIINLAIPGTYNNTKNAEVSIFLMFPLCCRQS